MGKWQKLLDLADQIEGNNRKNKSTKSSLVLLHKYLEKWDIPVPSQGIEHVTISHWYEIFRNAKFAIEEENKEKLVELVNLAASMNVTDLRVALRGKRWEVLQAHKVTHDGEIKYILELTEDQLNSIIRSVERKYKIEIKETTQMDD